MIVEDDKDDEDDNDVEDDKTDLYSGNIVFNNPGNSAMRLVFSSDFPVQLLKFWAYTRSEVIWKVSNQNKSTL